MATKQYRTVIADPPWQYDVSHRNGAAAKHYPTMTVDELCALPVGDLWADDAVMLMWGTWPKMPECLQVMAAWGFRYITGFPWIKILGEPMRDLWGDLHLKPKWGTGYWVRACSEFVAVGKRGTPALPEENMLGLLSNHFGHSRKPENLYHYAEQLEGPYLELFARRPREGWDVWGNEVKSTVQIARPVIELPRWPLLPARVAA